MEISNQYISKKFLSILHIIIMVEPNKSNLVEKKKVGTKYILSLSEKLGSGAYGAVYRGCEIADRSKEVAIKMIPLSINKDEFEQIKVLLEKGS